MKARIVLQSCLIVAIALTSLSACTELRARGHAREGNELYKAGDYEAAVRKYEQAQALDSSIAEVVFNKGLACRQLLIPGGRSKENTRAVDCALEAFSRLKELKPDDPRAEQLYVQTLFDADRFPSLVAMYREILEKNPSDRRTINALIQVYSRWGRWREALKWTQRRAKLETKDAEAQYAVGVLIYNLLSDKGGSGDNASFDPRPSAKPDQPPPNFQAEDLVGAERVRLADTGIEHLKRALELRPKYSEAMTYLNLLYRQKALAFFSEPAIWQKNIDQAENWRRKAIATGPFAKEHR